MQVNNIELLCGKILHHRKQHRQPGSVRRGNPRQHHPTRIDRCHAPDEDSTRRTFRTFTTYAARYRRQQRRLNTVKPKCNICRLGSRKIARDFTLQNGLRIQRGSHTGCAHHEHQHDHTDLQPVQPKVACYLPPAHAGAHRLTGDGKRFA